MTDDELVDLAEEAGSLTLIQYGVTSAKIEWLRGFAERVAAREIEECAKIIEQYCGAWDDQGFALAQAIRARREK